MTLSPEALRDLIRSMPPPLPQEERHRYSIGQVGIEGFFEFRQKTYKVIDLNQWRVGSSLSTELRAVCLETGEEGYVEWWKDPGLQAILSEVRLTLREIGVRESELGDPGVRDRAIRYSGTTFRYEEEFDALYGREERPVHIYRFASADGRRSLSLQAWGAGEVAYDVWLSEAIDPNAIEVLVVGGSAAPGRGGDRG